METSRTERSLASVRRWYATHREEYSELRKQRYADNPKYRKLARQRAIAYREARRKGLKVSRTLTRMVNGVPVEVFTSGYVADKLKCSPQLIRNWEARGWIPKPLFSDKHRLYTARQVELMKLMVETMRTQSKYALRAAQYDDNAINKPLIDMIHKTWGVVDHAGTYHGKESKRSRRSH